MYVVFGICLIAFLVIGADCLRTVSKITNNAEEIEVAGWIENYEEHEVIGRHGSGKITFYDYDVYWNEDGDIREKKVRFGLEGPKEQQTTFYRVGKRLHMCSQDSYKSRLKLERKPLLVCGCILLVQVAIWGVCEKMEMGLFD